jgi:RNA polymerase sigma-70 factor, ECF subfamily
VSQSETGFIQPAARQFNNAAALEMALEAAYPELRKRAHLHIWKSRLVRTRDEAVVIGDDVLHEALERVLKKAENYDPRLPVHAWVMRFVAYVILERQRAKRTDADRLIDERERWDAEGELLPSRVEMLQDAATQRFQQLQEILSLVGPADRQVLELRYVHELSFRELAAALGISENAARVRHHRAVLRLTKEFFAAEQAGSEES